MQRALIRDMPTEPPITNRKAPLETLLSRPIDDRRREYKYRFAQGVVFGLPVLALQKWGAQLGPADASRWVPILQALRAGWVVYVNLGMLAEGVILLLRRHKLSGDVLVIVTAIVLYVFSLVSVLHIFLDGLPGYRPLMFPMCVLLLVVWSGWRWLRFARR